MGGISITHLIIIVEKKAYLQGSNAHPLIRLPFSKVSNLSIATEPKTEKPR